MNTFTKTSVFVATLGVAALFLHAGSNNTQPEHGADAVIVESSAPEAIEAQAHPAGPVQNSLRVADAAEFVATEQYGNTSYAAESAIAAPARRAPNRTKREEAESKKQAATAKMSGPVAALAMAGGPGLAEIIVSYKDHPELFEEGRVEELGGEVLRHYEVLDLLAIRIPAESLLELAVEDDVARLSLDDTVVTSSTASLVAANTPVYPSNNVNYEGNGKMVAILDTGVAHHGALSNYSKQYSFLNGAYPQPELDDGEIEAYKSQSRDDRYGHGTHLAGVITGNGAGSSGAYKGTADGAWILSLQVLDSYGHGQVSDVMAALDWLLKYGDAFNVRVANLSFGKPITESAETDPLVAAVEAVWDSGIAVVVAAGNFGREGYFSITSPGNSRKVITVGSLTDNGTGSNFGDDYVSTYSSKGPTVEDHIVKPDLVAPGNRLVATTPEVSYLRKLLPDNFVACSAYSGCTDNYLELSGTSMSTAMVSAAAARMLDKEPWLSPATIKARLMRSARKIDDSPVVAGAGLLDVDAAMNETGVVSGEALSPHVIYESETGGTLIQDTAQLWGSDIWGAGYLWTDGVAANGYLWTDGTGIEASGYLWTDGVKANGYLWTDGSLWASGYLWTDGSISAFGYLWTDGVEANGYLWTDGGVEAKGYLWTDGTAFRAMSLYDLYSENPSLNDDEHTSE